MDIDVQERRADEAELRLASLEAVVFGKGGDSDAVGNVSDAFRVQLILQLREVRQALGAAAFEQRRLEQDLAEAQAQSKRLVAENEKLKYRNSHLVRSVRETEAQCPPPPPPPLKRWSTTPWETKSPLTS